MGESAATYQWYFVNRTSDFCVMVWEKQNEEKSYVCSDKECGQYSVPRLYVSEILLEVSVCYHLNKVHQLLFLSTSGKGKV